MDTAGKNALGNMAICRRAAADTTPPATRQQLIAELAAAANLDLTREPAPSPFSHDDVPRPGSRSSRRGRPWLVEAVAPGEHRESPLLRLACLDDDAHGRTPELLWDLEISHYQSFRFSPSPTAGRPKCSNSRSSTSASSAA